MEKAKVIVAGALGLIGRAVIAEYAGRDEVEVVGLSRRTPDVLAAQVRCQYRSVDLTDAQACARSLADLDDATHLVFAAWTPGRTSTAAEGARQIDNNFAMFRNVLDALLATARRFRHVTLMQGSKAYGMHFGPIDEPAREDDPRTMPPNFYYDQEDYLRERCRGRDWSWTIFRPVTVFGFAAGSPINVITALGVYASICRHLGMPLRYPGTEGGLRILRNAVEAELISEAVRWAGQTAAARGEIFNLADGDTYTWRRLWPQVADLFRMEVAPVQAMPLVDVMSCQEPVWNDMMKAHGLVFPYRELAEASWPTAEGHFKREYDGIVNPLKLRKFGFGGFRDTQDVVVRHLAEMMRQKVIPNYAGL